MFLILLWLQVAFILGLFIALKLCRRKTIKTIYEMDFAPVSGGTNKNFIGGVVTILYYIILLCLISGLLVSNIYYLFII